MNEPGGLKALWAIRSKHPGDGADYRVLAAGPGDAAARLNGILVANQPGSPTTTQPDRTDSLPWLTIAAVGEDAPFVTLAETEWSDDTDRGRRAIARTRACFVGYDDLAGLGATYTELRAALQRAEFPRDGEGLVLRVDPVKAHPGRPPSAWALGVAALLLEGRVVVTGCRGMDVDTRVAAIDAVAALLPFGLRADLSAATWVTAPGQRRHRLCFADHGDQGLIEVPASGAPPEPHGEPARRYLRLAREALARGRPEAELSAFLASCTAPCSFERDPEVAADAVADFDIEAIVVTDIRAGVGRPKDALRALLRTGTKAFPAAERGEVFCLALLAGPTNDELTRIVSQWSADLVPAVAEAVAREMQSGQRSLILATFADEAAHQGALEELLCAVFDRLPRPHASDVLSVLRNQVLRQNLPSWSELRRRLLTFPATAVDVAARTGSSEDTAKLLAWLAIGRDRLPAWLTVLRSLAGQGPSPTQDDVHNARSEYRELATGALLVATGQRTLSRLPDLLWEDLVERIAEGGERSRRMVDFLGRITPDVQDPASVGAHLDVLAHLAKTGWVRRPEPTPAVDYLATVLHDATIVARIDPAQASEVRADVLAHRVHEILPVPRRVDLLSAVLAEPLLAGAHWVTPVTEEVLQQAPLDLLTAIDARGMVTIEDAPGVTHSVALARLRHLQVRDPAQCARWVAEIVAVERRRENPTRARRPSWAVALDRSDVRWTAREFAELCDAAATALCHWHGVNFRHAMAWLDGIVDSAAVTVFGGVDATDVPLAMVQVLDERRRRHEMQAAAYQAELEEFALELRRIAEERDKRIEWQERELRRAEAVAARIGRLSPRRAPKWRSPSDPPYADDLAEHPLPLGYHRTRPAPVESGEHGSLQGEVEPPHRAKKLGWFGPSKRKRDLE